MTRTWQDASREIIDALDVAAEYRGLGFSLIGEPSATGWTACHVYGGEDRNPSAGVCVSGEHPTKGRYKEHTGEARNLSLWEAAVVAGRFPTWQEAREQYRKLTRVQGPDGRAKDPNKQLHFREWNESLVNTWCLKKPPITPVAVRAAGGCLAEWPAKSRQHVVIALPVYRGPDAMEEPIGWTILAKSGRPLPLFQGKGNPPRMEKMLSVGGSKGGWMNRAGLTSVTDAELVWKTEGPCDMLALQSAIPLELWAKQKHAVVTNSNGTMEIPTSEKVEIFRDKRVCVVHDCDTDGQAGGRRWAEAIATVAEEVRFLTLPYEITEKHGKDLRDWLNEGTA